MVRSDATAYLDNLGCHVVYFHDGGDKSQTTEFDFIKKGVVNSKLLLHYAEPRKNTSSA